jgi:L-alanine-DL-glutamate epimerase-like enolase superfamily enzyme
LKITDVQTACLAIPMKPLQPPIGMRPGRDAMRKQIVVRLLTDEGIHGLGEAFAYGPPLAVCNVIEEGLKPLLVGQDPMRIEYLVDLMHRSSLNYARRGLGLFAISGIEIALWDLLGKMRNAPLYELLGGATRPKLRAYASLARYATPEHVAEACHDFVAQGFTMLKLHQIDVPSVKAAREAVGPDVEIMLDTNCPWTVAEAIAMARAFEPYRLFWLEEPVWPPEDYDGLAQVKAASPMLIACGENEGTVYGFRDIVNRRAADVLQPSVTKVGGVSEMRKIAALANAANVMVVPHSYYFGPGLAATLHVAATFTGGMPIEFPTGEHETPFLTEPIKAIDGFVTPPSGPGLGVEINEDAIKRHRYGPETPF